MILKKNIYYFSVINFEIIFPTKKKFPKRFLGVKELNLKF